MKNARFATIPTRAMSRKQAARLEREQSRLNMVRTSLAFGLLLLLTIFAVGTARAADPVRILSFGDSLSAGYQLPSGAGFTDQLQAHLDAQGLQTEVINAAVSGDTTATGLSRLDWSTPDNIDLVLLELGANDALQGLPVDKAKANLSSMINKFQDRNATVLLIGMRAPPNMGATYVESFDAIFPALAEQHGTEFYPFFLKDVAAVPSLNLADGMHPNEDGIKIIVKNIAPTIIDIVKTLK